MKIKESINNLYPLGTDFYIEIFDKKEIIFTGDAEITNLENTVLKIKTGEHAICFSGKDFKISCYTADGFVIKGSFEKIEFY